MKKKTVNVFDQLLISMNHNDFVKEIFLIFDKDHALKSILHSRSGPVYVLFFIIFSVSFIFWCICVCINSNIYAICHPNQVFGVMCICDRCYRFLELCLWYEMCHFDVGSFHFVWFCFVWVLFEVVMFLYVISY